MSMADPLSEDDELLAAELAFGLLDGEERRTAEARTVERPFADAVELWRGYAAGLLAGPDTVPRPSIWTRIEARLPANDSAAGPAATLRWWQAGTLVASAAAIVLTVVAVERGPLAPPPPQIAIVTQPSAPLVAVLTAPKGRGVVTVSFDPGSGHIVSAPTGVAIGDHSSELWVIPADGKPRSLGVVADKTPGWTKAPAAAAPAITPGATLAISIEPVGGSPTGQPTGKVILSGKVVAT